MLREDAVRALRSEAQAGRRYDLVLVDPPYEMFSDLQPALARLVPRVLADDGLLVVETDARVEPELPLELRTSRTYGRARLTLFQHVSRSAGPGGGGAGPCPAGADAGEGRE